MSLDQTNVDVELLNSNNNARSNEREHKMVKLVLIIQRFTTSLRMRYRWK